jgi:hypothetical protein
MVCLATGAMATMQSRFVAPALPEKQNISGKAFNKSANLFQYDSTISFLSFFWGLKFYH